MSELQALYQDTIRRHAAQPVGLDADIRATHQHELFNAQCGDRVHVKLRLAGDTIEAAAFEGEGCAICMASASLLCTHLPGQTRADARCLHGELAALLTGDAPARPADPLAPLAGVRPYPSRVHCALLPWRAAERALQQDSDPA